MITRVNANPNKAQQTATPDKYPQGYFKEKKCRCCKHMFKPKALLSCIVVTTAKIRRQLINTSSEHMV